MHHFIRKICRNNTVKLLQNLKASMLLKKLWAKKLSMLIRMSIFYEIKTKNFVCIFFFPPKYAKKYNLAFEYLLLM